MVHGERQRGAGFFDHAGTIASQPSSFGTCSADHPDTLEFTHRRSQQQRFIEHHRNLGIATPRTDLTENGEWRDPTNNRDIGIAQYRTCLLCGLSPIALIEERRSLPALHIEITGIEIALGAIGDPGSEVTIGVRELILLCGDRCQIGIGPGDMLLESIFER